MDCSLSKVYITDDEELKISKFNFEDTAFANKLEVLLHHGYVNFYSSIGDDWYEFDAKFTNGKLDFITGGKI